MSVVLHIEDIDGGEFEVQQIYCDCCSRSHGTSFVSKAIGTAGELTAQGWSLHSITKLTREEEALIDEYDEDFSRIWKLSRFEADEGFVRGYCCPNCDRNELTLRTPRSDRTKCFRPREVYDLRTQREAVLA